MADGQLPHFTNSIAAQKDWEPIYQNQFGVTFEFPQLLDQLNNNSSQPKEDGVDSVTLSQQIKTLSGLPEITPLDTVDQYYKFAKRTYAAARPEETTAEIEIEFEVNLNNGNEMYAYNMMRAWSNIVFDPMNGSMGLKADYVGNMNVYIFNKRGQIFRQFEFKKVYPIEELTQMELDFQGDDLYVLTAKFKADYWNEKLVGMNQFIADDPFITSQTDEVGGSIAS